MQPYLKVNFLSNRVCFYDYASVLFLHSFFSWMQCLHSIINLLSLFTTGTASVPSKKKKKWKPIPTWLRIPSKFAWRIFWLRNERRRLNENGREHAWRSWCRSKIFPSSFSREILLQYDLTHFLLEYSNSDYILERFDGFWKLTLHL